MMLKKRKAKKRSRPPYAGGFSVRNSHTSPARIALREKQAEALQYRRQGYSVDEIAKEMKRPPTTVYRWLSDAIERITFEPAQAVLKLELQRLDEVQSGIYNDAVGGHLPALYAYLALLDRRAKLLGLYPREGQPQQMLVNIAGDGEKQTKIIVQFEAGLSEPDEPVPRDVTPRPAVTPQRAPPTEPPIIDAEVLRPTSVPITGDRRKPGDWMR
jgi:hypothetical protein